MLDSDTFGIILSYFDIDDLVTYYWDRPNLLNKKIQKYYKGWPTIKKLIKTGKIKAIKYQVKNGIDTPIDFLDLAVSAGQLELVKFFKVIGMDLEHKHMTLAIKSGCLNIVKYLRSFGISVSEDDMEIAEQLCHFDIIAYLEQ